MIVNPIVSGMQKKELTYFIWNSYDTSPYHLSTCIFEKGMTWQEYIESEYNTGAYNGFAGEEDGLYKFMIFRNDANKPGLGPDGYPGVDCIIEGEWKSPLLTDEIIPLQEYRAWW